MKRKRFSVEQIVAVLHTAGRLDDEIVSRWGGNLQFD